MFDMNFSGWSGTVLLLTLVIGGILLYYAASMAAQLIIVVGVVLVGYVLYLAGYRVDQRLKHGGGR